MLVATFEIESGTSWILGQYAKKSVNIMITDRQNRNRTETRFVIYIKYTLCQKLIHTPLKVFLFYELQITRGL